MKTIIFDMYGVIIKESKGNFIPYTHVENLRTASKFGIDTILFNRDNEIYDGKIVYSFDELARIL